ncbi:MAG: hypothetical protein COB24_12425 [Hyphomicrobiales bacterium]|nr:MAG: hypothetical protein COB24_12425 [Hyphomicrobiales bacterium]
MFNIAPRILNNIKVGRQVTIVTTLSIIALITLAVASYIEADGVATSNHATSHASSKAHVFNKIYSDSLRMRRYEKDYLANFDAVNIEKFNEASEEALRDAHIFESIADTDDELQRVGHIIKGLQMSQVQFEKVIEMEQQLGITPESGIHGELRKLTHESEELLKKIQAAENNDPTLDILTVEMQMLHLDEFGFMLHNDEVFLEDFRHGVDLFLKSLETSHITIAEKRSLTTMINNYSVLFMKWSVLEQQTAKEIEKFDEIFASIEPELVEYSAKFDEVSRNNILNLSIVEAVHDQEMIAIYSAVLVMILIIAFLSLIVSTNISGRINVLSKLMETLSKGELNIDIVYTKFKNEFGVIARSLLVFKESAIEKIKNSKIEHERLAKEAQKAAELVVVIEEFRGFSSEKLINVGAASDQLESVSLNLMRSANEITKQSQVVKENVGETSMNVTGVAAATEEMSIAVSEISSQAAGSAAIVEEAIGKTGETVAKLKALTESAAKIETVVNLINEIAEQTNLLALNATIEAARAGDAGRGFAVVANEVKSLADQTGKATGEIAAQINRIQTDGASAAQTVAEMNDIIVNLSEASMGVAAAVEEQSAAVGEIANNVSAASDLSQQSASSMDVASESVEAVQTISEEVTQVATNMKLQVEALEGDIVLFLDKINAA